MANKYYFIFFFQLNTYHCLFFLSVFSSISANHRSVCIMLNNFRNYWWNGLGLQCLFRPSVILFFATSSVLLKRSLILLIKLLCYNAFNINLSLWLRTIVDSHFQHAVWSVFIILNNTLTSLNQNVAFR